MRIPTNLSIIIIEIHHCHLSLSRLRRHWSGQPREPKIVGSSRHRHMELALTIRGVPTIEPILLQVSSELKHQSSIFVNFMMGVMKFLNKPLCNAGFFRESFQVFCPFLANILRSETVPPLVSWP